MKEDLKFLSPTLKVLYYITLPNGIKIFQPKFFFGPAHAFKDDKFIDVKIAENHQKASNINDYCL